MYIPYLYVSTGRYCPMNFMIHKRSRERAIRSFSQPIKFTGDIHALTPNHTPAITRSSTCDFMQCAVYVYDYVYGLNGANAASVM